MKQKTGVYCWENLVNGKVYIGGAYLNFHRRHSLYLSSLARGKCHNKHLQYAWNKYGKDSFRFVIIQRCPIEEVEKWETYWIRKFNATKKGVGYNVCSVAGSRLGVPHTKEARRKMSLTKTGMVGTRLGAILTEETKAKIRASKLGSKLSLSTRLKMSESRRGKKWTRQRWKTQVRNHWSKGPNAKKIAAKISKGLLRRHAA